MSPKVRGLRSGVIGLLLAVCLVALCIRLAWAAPPTQSAASGEAIFRDKACMDAQGGATGAPPLAQAPATVPLSGDPNRGEALFMGNIHLRNDGPPCMGCHSIDSAGALGGGAMGPDLTLAFAKYGDAGLASILATIPMTTMKPIFTDHPLALEEQADLRAFIEASSSQPQANREALILALSLAGFVAAMILAGLVWRRRLHGVRRPLLERTRPGA